MMKIGNIFAIAFLLSSCTERQTAPVPEHVGFVKHVVDTNFVSEGVAVADINNDGILDIIAGAFWYEGPSWEKHEITEAKAYDYATGYSESFLNYAMDVNDDGWVDVIQVGYPGEEVVWYENPQLEAGHWEVHIIHTSLGNENPLFVDVDGDGRPDLVGNDSKAKEVIWLKAPSGEGSLKWEKIVVSSDEELGTHQFTHGLGVHDMNGDGRPDILIRQVWWEAPLDPTTHGWEFHPADFGEDCAHIRVMDVNEDGLLDVITSSAHAYGIWWHEQQQDESGNVSWKTHLIDDSFSQSHALELVDMNHDGYPDLVTGKRFFAHNGHDPGAHEPAVLQWYEFVPGEQPHWVPHLIDDDSGAGLNFVVADINGDGKLDVAVSNKKGVFYFEQVD